MTQKKLLKTQTNEFQQLILVGVAGFELATPCSQSRCANRTALRPDCLSKRVQS